MKIALITQILPYPPNAGPRVKTWNVLRRLVKRGHEVTLVSYVREEELRYLPVVERLCVRVYAVPIRRSRWKDFFYWMKSHLTGRPFLVERDDLPAMRRTINELLNQSDIDAIHMDQVTMTQFVPANGSETPNYIQVFDAHNATWTILNKMQNNAPWWLKPVLTLETNRMQRFEAQAIQRSDWTLVVSEIDRKALTDVFESNGTQPNKFMVMPIAVDTERLKPVGSDRESQKVLTFGTLHYAPNAEGIRWFLTEVWPVIRDQLPGTELTIAGANPPDDFIRYARDPDNKVTVTGYVDDLEPYFESASVLVVPVLSGSGMRVRILEALSRAMPVVSTSIGLEGIEANHEEHVLIADDSMGFADAVVRLIKDPGLRMKLKENARTLATTRYDWRIALDPLDRIYPTT